MAEATLSARGMPGYLRNKTLQLDVGSKSGRGVTVWERRQPGGLLPAQRIPSLKCWELLDIKLLFSWDQSGYCVLQLKINAEKKGKSLGRRVLKDL